MSKRSEKSEPRGKGAKSTKMVDLVIWLVWFIRLKVKGQRLKATLLFGLSGSFNTWR